MLLRFPLGPQDVETESFTGKLDLYLCCEFDIGVNPESNRTEARSYTPDWFIANKTREIVNIFIGNRGDTIEALVHLAKAEDALMR